jgi:O-methyltransferase
MSVVRTLHRLRSQMEHSERFRAARRELGMHVSDAYAILAYRWRTTKETHVDRELYRPLFQPWLSAEWSVKLKTSDPTSCVSPDRKYVLYQLLEQSAKTLEGDVAECGVYQGGTAKIFAERLRDIGSSKHLYLFDTFEGMPETDPRYDLIQRGDFSNTSLEAVRAYIGPFDNVEYHPGLVPATLEAIRDRTFCFAHIDLDIYHPIVAATEFFYSRLVTGGFMIYDDYGFPSCPGARKAVDDFFADKPEQPVVLGTGQCLVIKAPG